MTNCSSQPKHKNVIQRVMSGALHFRFHFCGEQYLASSDHSEQVDDFASSPEHYAFLWGNADICVLYVQDTQSLQAGKFFGDI